MERPTGRSISRLARLMPDADARIPLTRIFRVFFTIGAFSFGGGMLGWIHREIVVVRKWMTDEQFLPAVVLSRVLPGPNVSNLAIYIGNAVRGPTGAFVATVAVVCGPFFLCIGLAQIYDWLSGSALFHAALAGASAAAIGMGLRVAWSGAKMTCRSLEGTFIAAFMVISVGYLHWSLIGVVLGTAPVSIFLQWRKAQADA